MNEKARYPSIPEGFARAVEEHGRRVAIRVPLLRERRIAYQEATYRELWELSGRLAVWLSGQGVGEGDRVALVAKPSVGWAVAFFAIERLGAVVVPLDVELQPGEVERILREAEVGVLFCASHRYEELLPLADAILSLGEVIAVEAAPGVLSLWEVLPEEGAAAPDARPDPEALAVLMYTSGTTGDAKGAMLCHRNLVANVQAILEVLPVTPADRIVTIVPWYHIYGLTTTLLLPIWVGAMTIYSDDYRNLMQVARQAGFTIMVGVPKLYHTLFGRLEENFHQSAMRRILLRFAPKLLGWLLKRRLFTPGFRFFVSGGAALAAAVGAGLRRLGLGVIEGYGLTETSPVISLSDPFTRKAGTVGRPLPGVALRIDQPTPDGIGEVLVRGPSVMLGYYKNPKRTAEVLSPDGWFHTGDLGRLDRQGFLFLSGRKKNVIVLESGKNVYPEELEWELERIPEVEEVLVYEASKGGKPTVAAMIYPAWELLREQGIVDPEEVKAVLWERIREAQKNLATFKRLRSKDITLVDQPFEKSTKLEIKRHLYMP
jgi:long-chain acyl-CoA synthetase